MKSTISSRAFDGDDLQRMYEARFKGRIDYRNDVWTVLIRDYFQKYVRREDAVLDLGTGYGEFINNITCGKKFAMDLNHDTKHRVGADAEVFLQDCSTRWPLPDNTLDVVFTSNFFEHLSDTQALTRTLTEAKRCLKSGGRLIAMGPNIKYVPGAYWDFIDHHMPLTELSLVEAFTQQGFHIEKCIGKFMPFTMASGLHYPAFFVAAYLRLPLVWRIFGKQFLVIGRKGNV